MAMFSKPRSIRQRFTYSLAAVVGGTFIVLSVIFIVYNSRSLEKDLQLRLDKLAQLAVHGLSSALWQYNNEYVDDYLDSLFQYESVAFVSVYAENRLIGKKARDGLKNKDLAYFSSSNLFLVKQADILYQGTVIGKISLVLSREHVNRMMTRNGVLVVLVLFLIISSIFITMYVLYRKYLFIPLGRLEGSARAISKGGFDTKIDISSDDEIGNLARVLDQMINELTTTMASRDELETEIAERKRMEALLVSREQLLNEMGNIAKIGGWEHDLIQNKAVWTDEVYRMTEFDEKRSLSPAEHINLHPPGDRARLEKAYQHALVSGEPFDLELQCSTTKGHLFWGRVIGHPEFENGQCVRVKGTFQDITEKKRMENNLRHAQKMESIGTLAGGIAHDFNNILAAILGYAEMIRINCQPGTATSQHTDRVIEASLRAKELVKQILAFSHQTEAEEKLLQPALIIKETVKMLRSSLPTTIEIQLDIDSEPGVILADPTQIHQILTNLCTNAFHAMESTGGTLSISLKNKELTLADLSGDPHVRPGKFVELSVRDTGVGIAPEIKDKIFDPYFTTKEVGKGTGMGLAIIHGIVSRSGGLVTCQSTLGKGTVFYVYLPAHTAAAGSEIDSTLPGTMPSGHERILFVDDEEMLAELGKTMLERLGYKVTVKTDSSEAFQLVQNDPDQFDLVITDQTMPGLTGFDLARRILDIRPEMSIIICTGFSSQITEETAKTYGIKGFAMKPLAIKSLASLVRKVLDEAN